MSQIKVSYESEKLWKEIRVAKKCLKTVKKEVMALVGSSVFVAECYEQILSSVVMEMLSFALSVGLSCLEQNQSLDHCYIPHL